MQILDYIVDWSIAYIANFDYILDYIGLERISSNQLYWVGMDWMILLIGVLPPNKIQTKLSKTMGIKSSAKNQMGCCKKTGPDRSLKLFFFCGGTTCWPLSWSNCGCFMVFPRIGIQYPKMDGLFHGKTYSSSQNHGFVENGVRPEDVFSLQMRYFPLPGPHFPLRMGDYGRKGIWNSHTVLLRRWWAPEVTELMEEYRLGGGVDPSIFVWVLAGLFVVDMVSRKETCGFLEYGVE